MKEPLNIKLLFMTLLRRLPLLLIGAVIGAVLFGGGYYLKNYVFAPAPDYEAKSELYLTYSDEVRLENIYINDYTWQTLAQSDACVDEAIALLPFEIDKEECKSKVSAGLESDVRIVTIKATDKDPKKAVELANAYEKAIQKLGEKMEDVEEVQVFTSASQAVVKRFDNRTLRMSITGAVVGFIAMLVIVLFAFSVDDSVYLPEHMSLRYGIQTLACFEKRGEKISDWDEAAAKQNLNSVLEGKSRVYLSDITGLSGCEKEAVNDLLEAVKNLTDSKDSLEAADGINQNASAVSEIKGGDGVILLLQAGKRNGKLAERAIDYLKTQQIPVLGCILYGVNSRRLLRYLSSK